jgi:spore germination cell wall hydrolase CwlJ-like protein
VRIGYLLLVLALILLSGATSLYAALGDAPRCFPAVAQGTTDLADANPLTLELRQAVPSFAPEERDYLIRTIAFEASGETEDGKAAVAHVILNRQRSGRWGDTIKAVVTHPWQFEPWMTRRKELKRLSQKDPRYRSAARIADAVLAGHMPDPTAGATHFLNPTIVLKRRGGSLPAWAAGEGQPIGRHTFYAPDEGGAAPEQAAPVVSVVADSTLLAPRRGSDAAPPLQARRNFLATGHAEGACGQNELNARSPGLPTRNLVFLDAG